MLLKRINDFPKYWINFNGNVWSDYTNSFLKPRAYNAGYLSITLCKDGKHMTKSIHRLVATTFIDNPKKYPWVDHINGDNTDNSVDNLRWCSPQMNGHNRKDNCDYLNIQIRNDKQGFNVQFNKKGYEVSRSFHNLEKAIEFRDIIQNMINQNEVLDKVFVYTYNKNNRCINKQGKRYSVVIKKKYYGLFKTIEEAILKRDEILRQIL